MSAQGATLQNYNNELVSCIEDLRSKREEVNKSIQADEEEKGAPRRRRRPAALCLLLVNVVSLAADAAAPPAISDGGGCHAAELQQ